MTVMMRGVREPGHVNHRRAIGLLSAILVMLWPVSGAHAQTCAVNIAGALNFGVYGLVTPADGATTLTVRCGLINQAPGRTVNFVIKLTSGPGTYVNRLMENVSTPGEYLGYNLYTDAGRSLVWGDGTSGTVTFGGQFVHPPANQTTSPITIYGRIPANQNVSAGNYATASPITVIVEY